MRRFIAIVIYLNRVIIYNAMSISHSSYLPEDVTKITVSSINTWEYLPKIFAADNCPTPPPLTKPQVSYSSRSMSIRLCGILFHHQLKVLKVIGHTGHEQDFVINAPGDCLP